MAKVKTLNMKASLESQGYPVETNPSFKIDINRDEMKKVFLDLDSTQFISRFKWKGLPKNIYSWNIERMLYTRGSIALGKVGKTFFFLPYVSTSGLNVNGLATEIQLITYNGINENEGANFGGKLPVNLSGKYDEKAKAIILYDRFTAFTTSSGGVSRMYLQMQIIEQIVNRLSYLNINLVNSQGKNVIICRDEKQADVIRKELESIYNSTKNFALIRSNFDVQVINNDVEYKEQELWEDIVSWNNLRLECLGIENNGLFNKKERQLTGEVSTSAGQTSAVLRNSYNARKFFVEQVKEQFGNDPDFKEQFGEDFDVEIDEENVLRETITNEQNENVSRETIEKGEEENV